MHTCKLVNLESRNQHGRKNPNFKIKNVHNAVLLTFIVLALERLQVIHLTKIC